MMKENPNSNSSLKIVMRKINFLFSLFLIVTFIPSTILGGPIEDLKPGEWYEVPNSNISAVLPDPLPPGLNDPDAIMKSWNGGAYDTKRDRLIVWGGGHGDYGGNEIYVFDINTLSWSRIWGPSPDIPATGGSCNQTYSDGNPSSRHTYEGLEYIPTTDKFWSNGGSLYCGSGGSTYATWEFDFNTLIWERTSDAPSKMLGIVSAYDPVTGHVFQQGANKFSEYDPATGNYTVVGNEPSSGWWEDRMTGALDPERRIFVSVGQGHVRAWDLNTKTFTKEVSTTGGSAIVNAFAPGFVYDPAVKKFIGWAGGTSVYSLDTTTWTWTLYNPASTNTVIPTQQAKNGTFGRFRYIPLKNAFVVVNSIYGNVYIYKLSEGGGITPPTTTDTVSPTVSITSPSSGLTVSNNIAMSATASDNVGVAGVQFKLDGVNLSLEDTVSPYSITWDTTQASNGSHTISAVARDTAGNTATSASVIVTVSNEAQPTDTISPAVSITSPSSGLTVSNNIAMSATASDNVGVAGVQFKLDGVNLSLEDTVSPYSITWDTTQASNGLHTISAVARDSAGNTTSAAITVTVSNVTTPTGQINIPLNTWVAVPKPPVDEGPCPGGQYGSCKHMRLTHNPINGRIYFQGGDYLGGAIDGHSGRQEVYSYSIKDGDWILEYPYCGPAGDVQPDHPDEVGWVYDTNRDIFWMLPGVMFGSAGNCVSSLIKSKIMTFNPSTKKWTNTNIDKASNVFGFYSEHNKFANYDPQTDTIIQFYGLNGGGVAIYDIKAGTWGKKELGTKSLGQEYTAIAVEERIIYAIDPPAGKLYRYNIDSKTLDFLTNTPPETISNIDVAMPIWDSVNNVLLWPQISDHSGFVTMYVYHPDTNEWEKPPMYQPEGISVRGNSAVFDPYQNVLLIMGGAFHDPNPQHFFLYRYGNGTGTTPPPPTSDTTAPTVPTSPAATAISSSQINVSWTASTDNVGVAGYRIYRNSNLLTTTTATSYQNTGLSPSTTYTYRVSAYDAAGNQSGQSALVSATTFSGGTLGENIINANPSNYLSLLPTLQPGDTLLLASGTYSTNGLPVFSLNGTPSNPIIIKGPDSGPLPLILGNINQNTVRIDGSSYITIKNLEVDGRDLGVDGVNFQSTSHHVTLDNLLIKGVGDHQQTVGISSNMSLTWNITIRNCTIIGAGTGIYLGNSDGNEQFVNGVIENNLIMDTIGYNMEIKHQNPRPTISGMPTTKSKTIIRHNVYSKANNSSGGVMARPNILVGHFPLSGPGQDDVYEIYGNVFYQNPSGEPLFQGEGNFALYNNLFINTMDTFTDGSVELDPSVTPLAILVRPHNDKPRDIRIFNNTIVAKAVGISVSGGYINFQQKVIGNAVFAQTPIQANDQQDNIVDTYLAASNYLINPTGTLEAGTLDIFPKVGMLTGTPLDTSSFSDFTDWNLDFNGDFHTGIFRGAYAGEGLNPGWIPKLEKKILGTLPVDTTAPTTPQSLNAIAQNDNQIDLTWQASSDPESGISKYNIYRDGGNIGQSTTTSFSDIGLTEGTTYTYEVSAINGAGLESAKSSPVSATTLADTIQPTITSVTISDSTHVIVVFSEPIEEGNATNVSNYTINNAITVSSAWLGLDFKTVILTTGLHTEGVSYTLTVNNIQDLSIPANIISSNTTVNYNFEAQLTISNLTVGSGQNYEIAQDGITNGALVYIDRGYTFSTIPTLVFGATYIKTANSDKNSSDASFLTFDVNQDVTVYVAHDDRITTKPPWMSSFIDTGEDLVTTDSILSVFAKDFPPGTITLGGNKGSGNSMYTVIVIEQGTDQNPDSTPPSPPTGILIK